MTETSTQAAPAPLHVRVRVKEAYMAENARRRITGRSLGFEGGAVYLDANGNGQFSFDADDTEHHPADEDGPGCYSGPKIDSGEMLELRDWLNEAFPLDLSTPTQIAAQEAENAKLRAERERLFDGNTFMADGEIEMSAAEDVLAWLLIERLGCVDDRGYTPNEAQDIISVAIKQRDAAEAENDKLRAERDALQSSVWTLEAKVDALAPHGTCACSWDEPNDLCAHHSPKLVAAEAEVARLTEALKGAARAAELALFVIRKQGVMPNSSWAAGFDKDMKPARDTLASLSQSPSKPAGGSTDENH